jgi:hypothetical protein
MAETGVGVRTLLLQWKPIISGGIVTHLEAYPPNVGGEPNGATLAGYLTNTVSAAAAQEVDPTLTEGFLMTYLNVDDYNNVSSTAVKLKYEGNDFSQLAVEKGNTFWGMNT